MLDSNSFILITHDISNDFRNGVVLDSCAYVDTLEEIIKNIIKNKLTEYPHGKCITLKKYLSIHKWVASPVIRTEPRTIYVEEFSHFKRAED